MFLIRESSKHDGQQYLSFIDLHVFIYNNHSKDLLSSITAHEHILIFLLLHLLLQHNGVNSILSSSTTHAHVFFCVKLQLHFYQHCYLTCNLYFSEQVKTIPARTITQISRRPWNHKSPNFYGMRNMYKNFHSDVIKHLIQHESCD